MSAKERRIHARKSVEDSALIHLNTQTGPVEKTGKIENISLGGVCFKNLADTGAKTSISYLEGVQAAVYFRSMPVSVFGTVTRNGSDGKLAIKIRQSTDDALWEKLTA